jgi:hypothetical protein
LNAGIHMFSNLKPKRANKSDGFEHKADMLFE